MNPPSNPPDPPNQSGRIAPPTLEVFLAFLRLGCLSFGGPIAHLGYFHDELVHRRRWCPPATYAELVALAQSLPGPASSQVAFALGLLRAGLPGALAAWTAFTLPSAVLLTGFALFLNTQHALGALPTPLTAALHGLQLVAVAIVAQALQSMQRTLAPDYRRLALALAAAALAGFAPASIATLAPILLGAITGVLILQSPASPPIPAPTSPLSRAQGLLAAALFLAGLTLLSPLAAHTGSRPLAVFSAFYRTGALVFGGGHVVLPLLEHAIVAPGWVPQSTFLAGYGATQAIPGPLFTFAAFLGASLQTHHPIAAAALTLAAIFLPGLLLMLAVLPFWATLRERPGLQRALRGINAAVVGILFAAWIRPVCSTAVHTAPDALLAAAAFLALTRLKLPPATAVLLTVLAAVTFSLVR